MAKNLKTHIFCYDPHRGFSDSVRKKFSDSARYSVFSIQSRQEIIDHLTAVKENKFCKIAILGLNETTGQYNIIDKLTIEIKRIDMLTGLILLCPSDKIEDIKRTVKFNIDAYVPVNANASLRIHNYVKKLISEHNIGILRKRRNITFYILLGFLLISALLFTISYFRFPQYF